MHKFMLAIAASAVLGMLPVSGAVANDTDNGQGANSQAADSKHHHTRQPVEAASSEGGNPAAVRDGYRMNGTFDWRRRGEKDRPWYAHGYNDNCVAWEEHAYHQACDENSRY